MSSEDTTSTINNCNAAKKSTRFRCTTKSTSISPASSSDESIYEYSEDEWEVSSSSKKKKRTRAKKTVPKQTLKLKLLERTRKLRQLSKQSNALVAEHAEQKNIYETSTDAREKVCSALATINESESNKDENGVETTEDSKPPLLIESHKDVKNVEYRSLTVATPMKNETLEEKMRISDTIKRACDREPVVIEYSINRPQISSATSLSYPPSTSQRNLSSISSQPVPWESSLYVNDIHVPFIRLNDSAVIDRANRCQKDVIHPQLRSNSNFRGSAGTRNESEPLNVTAPKPSKFSKIEKTCVSTQQKILDVGSRRRPPATRLNSIRIIKNFKNQDAPFSRTRKTKVLSSGQNHRSSDVHKITKNDFELALVRKDASSQETGPLSMTKTSDYVLKKFGNISPNGTVIHTGTGSVTITPRKTLPEKPPIQRKLFKNEIEGTISVRSIEKKLRYVVNLANGTYIVLSDMQVEKLREQHKGALPIKLKIPVPYDVAHKIEPSFLIED